MDVVPIINVPPIGRETLFIDHPMMVVWRQGEEGQTGDSHRSQETLDTAAMIIYTSAIGVCAALFAVCNGKGEGH